MLIKETGETLEKHLEEVNPLKPLYYRFTEEELKQKAVLTTIIYKIGNNQNDNN